MSAFESVEATYVHRPVATEVLERIRREEPCQANPLSPHCNSESGRDEFLLGDVPGATVCENCPVFDRKLQALEAAWESWLLDLENVYA